ncbi:MAG: CRTAC1 family protein [Acidobacteriota bacterium]|nr:CRTAC1 family protein [Acidobacteriota bacterium]
MSLSGRLAILCAVFALLTACGEAGLEGGGGPGEGRAGDDEPELGLFREVAPQSGFDFQHVNAMTGAYRFAEMMGPGGAMADVDGDGDLDLYLVQGARLDEERELLAPSPYAEPLTDRLYLNRLEEGEGLRFQDATDSLGVAVTEHGMGVAAGDYDNDGDVDLYITSFGPNRLLRNRGNGTFDDATEAAGVGELRWSVPAVFFDYDGDGWLDLFVGNYVGLSAGNEKACYADTGTRDYCGPAAYNPEADRLFRNRGDGTFEDVTGTAGLLTAFGPALGAITGDFDGDGRLDLYVANDGAANQLWLNQGNGSFRDEALLAGVAVNADGMAEASMGVVAADFDGDADEDLFLTHLNRETNTLYLNDGRGLFEDRSRVSGLGAASIEVTGFGAGALDYDNDGLLDVLSVNGAVKILESQQAAGDPYPLRQPNQLFLNTGPRDLGGVGFVEIAAQRAGRSFQRSEVSRGAAFGDVDNDGDTDVLVVNSNAPARLLINQHGNRSPWIGLDLRTTGGRHALGAWVGVFVADRPAVWRRVRTGGSYASANDPRVLVGLGGAGDVEGVEVHWLAGGVEVWPSLEPGRYHTLIRGQGQPAGEGSPSRTP